MSDDGWAAASRRHLHASLARVAAFLPGAAEAELVAAEAALAAAELALPAPSSVQLLAEIFGLDEFERDVLLLAAGHELDAELAARMDQASFGLALARLPGAHLAALSPESALRRHGLLELAEGQPLLAGRLLVDERVVRFLLLVPGVDPRLSPFVTRLAGSPEGQLSPSHRGLAGTLAAHWTAAGGEGSVALVELVGADLADKLAVVAEACAGLGLVPFRARAADLPSAPIERDRLARLWEREALLSRAALVVDADEASPEVRRSAAAFVERLDGAVVLCSREPVATAQRTAVCLRLDRPGAAEQLAHWQAHLGPLAPSLAAALPAVVAQFRLGSLAIARTAARLRAAALPAAEVADQLWDTCRIEVRPRLDELAERLGSCAGFDDIVLPAVQLQLLRDIVAQVRSRARVHEDWGFARTSDRGFGVTSLFAGASGTGKTMAAEVIATALRLDLYRVDLSQVVSKYIGETEKNLQRVFDAADDGGVILLFDEADALFGKRSEVKDSHDRYANLEVSYLLQRMEAYRGLAILTTNMRSSLDAAFTRRLRFVVEFPFPGPAERAQIWHRAFPPAAPTDGLDVKRLATLHAAGGNIRNIAIAAAFFAADAGEPVRMHHLVRAARAEWMKLDRSPAELDRLGW